MAHGPVNQAWRVCVSTDVQYLRLTKEEYDILRKERTDLFICVLRNGSKVTKIIRMDNPSGEDLHDEGFTHQNGRTWYMELNVTATEYDE